MAGLCAGLSEGCRAGVESRNGLSGERHLCEAGIAGGDRTAPVEGENRK